MEYPMGPASVDPLEVYKDPQKLGRKLGQLIAQTEKAYEDFIGWEMIRNLAYYRGRFWAGDGYRASWRRGHDYKAERNEVFPILDTIVSSLALDLPQVEAIKRTVSSTQRFTRDMDPTIRGRRVSAILNHFAEEDDLDETVQELVLHALLFQYGVMKVSWSTKLGRPIVRTKLPWEVFFDPAARHIRDAAWAFERVTLHWSDFKRRVEAGVYETSGKKAIKPDSFPRGLLDLQKKELDQHEERLRQIGLKEYVGIVEFWDFRRRRVYHVHPDTEQILMEAKMPYGRPYEVLVFHNGVGRIGGIPLTSLMAPQQQDVNELVSARREIVHRIVPRQFWDKAFWKDENQWKRFLKSKTWEAARLDVPHNRKLREAYHTVEAHGTTYDFNNHLNEGTEGMRRTAGEGDFQRGQTKNIRTAEEANMLREAVGGRTGVKVNRLVKVVTRMFKHILDVTKWAVRNPEASQIPLESITYATQDDIGPEILKQDLLEHSGQFRLLPFSPAMEDKLARRSNMERMMQHIEKLIDLGVFDPQEWGRELVDDYGWRPSILAKEAPQPQQGAPQPGMPLPMPQAPGGPPPLELVQGGAPPALPGPMPGQG